MNLFVEKARKVHGDLYDYSKVEYINSISKVIIICKKHGEFLQRPADHINKKAGCPKCKAEKLSIRCKGTTDSFVKKAKEIRGNLYDYSLVEYKNIEAKVKIICKKHGEFEQSPYLHLKGSGCPKCYYETIGDKNRLSSNDFIKKAKEIYEDLYDYSLVEYINNKTPVKIICKKHGEFEKIPTVHINQKVGCPLCTLEKIKADRTQTTDEYIEKARKVHGDLYDYSKTKYVSVDEKITIICKKHGEFLQKPYEHLFGKGCIKCGKGRISKSEKELLDFIKQNYNENILENSKQIISPLELDIYLPEIKLAIEYNGLYWHSELEKDKNYHLTKNKLCENQGIHLIHIYEDDWIYKQDIVKSRILNLLGKSNKIYARDCEIREGILFKDYKEFLEKNHIQGYNIGKHNIGLYCNNDLVSLMTFGSLRRSLGQVSKEGYFELLRFCNKLNTTVVGGANKLFSYFVDKYKPVYIVSYADRSWTMNNGKTLYDKLGFNLTGITKPNYSYIVDGVRENRFKYRKDILVKEGYDMNKSEHEIMFERGYYRIYDSGNLKYEFKNI